MSASVDLFHVDWVHHYATPSADGDKHVHRLLTTQGVIARLVFLLEVLPAHMYGC